MVDYAGQQLGNYRLLRLLGQGGFADVYLGEHIHLQTLAAIKVLHIQMGSNELADFRREARIIAHLVHPHIIRVLDFGVQGNTPFLVMDYAPNGTLRQAYPKGTRLLLPTIISYTKQVAEALQYAHDRKVIHRDVKPGNMLLDSNNQILLSDFGISAVEQSTSLLITQRTLELKTAGTASYMAPEQIQGNPHPSSDQYALGVVVYEWLCGSLPFSGEPFSVMYQHVHVPPPPLREKLPTISPAVEQVVLRALAKDPQQRYPSIWEFAQTLEKASQAQEDVTLPALPSRISQVSPDMHKQSSQADRETTFPALPSSVSEPISIEKPVQKPIRRRRKRTSIAVAMLLITLAIILVGGSVALLISSSNKPGNATPANNTNATAEAHIHASATASLLATATAATNTYNTATAKGVMDGFDAQHTHVNPYEKIITPANVARLVQAWRFSTGDSIGSVPTVANGIVYINSNDKKDGNLYALNATTGQVLWTRHIGSYDFGCAPTVANGVVYMGAPDDNLYALNARTGNVLWTAPTEGRIGSSPTLFNGVIYIGSDDGTLYAFNASTGKQLWAIPTGGDIRSSPAVANGVVYVGSDDGHLYALNAANGNPLWKFPTGGKVRSSPAAVNGVVYVGSDDGHLYALNAATGKIIWSLPTAGGIESSPAVANGVVYAGSGDGKLYAVDAAKGTLLWSATTGSGINSSPSIANGVLYIGSRDNKIYAFSASGCRSTSCSPLWMAATGGPISSSPTVANGFVYIGSDDHSLYAFHLAGTSP
jgi:outer membrane protein assembly factor BamB